MSTAWAIFYAGALFVYGVAAFGLGLTAGQALIIGFILIAACVGAGDIGRRER